MPLDYFVELVFFLFVLARDRIVTDHQNPVAPLLDEFQNYAGVLLSSSFFLYIYVSTFCLRNSYSQCCQLSPLPVEVVGFAFFI